MQKFIKVFYNIYSEEITIRNSRSRQRILDMSVSV